MIKYLSTNLWTITVAFFRSVVSACWLVPEEVLCACESITVAVELMCMELHMRQLELCRQFVPVSVYALDSSDDSA